MKKSLLITLGLAMTSASVFAQPATTAKAFRMYNDATSSVTITAAPAVGTGTFLWPQPAAGVFKSTAGGLMSIGAVNLNSADVAGILPVGNGGTGLSSVPANNLLVGNGTSTLSLLAPVANRMLATDGTGVISWQAFPPPGFTVPFSAITSGDNVQPATMRVGTGSILRAVPGSTGIVEANQFVTAASTSIAVDLATTEVAGILPGGNGGTGVASVDLNEVVLGNGASGITSLNNPAGARIMTHPGGAAVAPAWSTSIPAGVTVSFDQITSGTNAIPATMTLGTGSTLTFTGTGIVNANQFNGSGSTTNAVDLATAEVAGTLPIARGGTNATSVGANGSVAYSTGSAYSFSLAGSSGQFLQSTGAGAPVWVTGSVAGAKGTVVGTGTYTYTVAAGIGSLAGRQIMVTFQNAGAGGLQTTYAVVSVDAPVGSFTVEFANNIVASESFHWVVF